MFYSRAIYSFIIFFLMNQTLSYLKKNNCSKNPQKTKRTKTNLSTPYEHDGTSLSYY